jgi:hypothetical protein
MMAVTAQSSPVRTGASAPQKPVRLWLWLPLTPLFWLLSPFALLVAPLLWVWLPRPQRPPRVFATAIAFGRLLVSLSGLVVDVDAPGARLSIRIF